MTFLTDDACPFDWAEFNLPPELLPARDGLLRGYSVLPAEFHCSPLHGAGDAPAEQR